MGIDIQTFANPSYCIEVRIILFNVDQFSIDYFLFELAYRFAETTMPRGGENKDGEKDKGRGDHAGNAVGDSPDKHDDKRKPKRYNQYNRNRNSNRFYGKNRKLSFCIHLF